MATERHLARGTEVRLVELLSGVSRVVVMAVEGGPRFRPYVFEGTAYEIWRRIDGTRTLDQIAAELAGQTGADPGIVAADTTAFVSQLLELGLVTYLEPGAAEQ